MGLVTIEDMRKFFEFCKFCEEMTVDEWCFDSELEIMGLDKGTYIGLNI